MLKKNILFITCVLMLFFCTAISISAQHHQRLSKEKETMAQKNTPESDKIMPSEEARPEEVDGRESQHYSRTCNIKDCKLCQREGELCERGFGHGGGEFYMMKKAHRSCMPGPIGLLFGLLIVCGVSLLAMQYMRGRHLENQAMIEKGISPYSHACRPKCHMLFLYGGVIFVFIAIGLFFRAQLHARFVMPLALGVALLICYFVARCCHSKCDKKKTDI